MHALLFSGVYAFSRAAANFVFLLACFAAAATSMQAVQIENAIAHPEPLVAFNFSAHYWSPEHIDATSTASEKPSSQTTATVRDHFRFRGSNSTAILDPSR